MTNTVNTNAGALTALSSLRLGTTNLNSTLKRIDTGYRVADHSDDAAIFSAAQGVRSNIKAYASVQSSLSGGIALGEVAMAGIQSIYKVVGDMKAKLANLADGSLTTAQQDVYRGDIAKMIESINMYIAQADYNGKNLLAGDARAQPLTFVADVGGMTLNYSSPHQLDWDSDQFLGPNVLFPDATDVSENVNENPPDITTARQGLASFEGRLLEMSQNITAQKRAMEQQRDFVSNMVDSMKIALGALVDADVADESATLQSRQVAQQLTLQALSMANQQPNVLLSLLR